MKQSDYAYAARMRDVIRKAVKSVLDDERPEAVLAVVSSVNAPAQLAYVTFPGETTAVPVRYGIFVPGVGSTVRVEGPRNGRYVGDVVSGTYTLR